MKKTYNTVILITVLTVQAFLLMIMAQCITFAKTAVLAEWFRPANLCFLLYNFSGYLFLVSSCYVLFRRFLLSYLIPGACTVLFSVVNNMKWEGLNECITVSDFSKLSEALGVAGEAEFVTSSGTWISMCAGVLSIFIWLYFDVIQFRSLTNDTKHIWLCRIFFLGSFVFLLLFSVIDMENSRLAKQTEERTADKIGPLVYFWESVLTINAQSPYTGQEAKVSYDEYVDKGIKIMEGKNDADNDKKNTANEKEKHPNIIVIMDEAFYDVNRFEGAVSYSENPMSAFEEVKAESSYGNAMVNIYGGSTHFSEFEFLTGWNTKGMSSGSCPYKEYFLEKQPSFAWYLKNRGYYTMAIHPYNGIFWDRYKAYPRMGFDKFIDRSQMTYTDMCGYISDDALVNEIIAQYEKNKGGEKPFFCFGVSVANHIAIINGEEKQDVPDNIKVTFHNDKTGYGVNRKKWFAEYVSGISKSGEALKKLTDYFKMEKEPVVIVFFGDHAPSYALDLLRAGDKEETLAYSTPYIIWDNIHLEKEQELEMNVSFLSTYLLMKLSLPLPEQGYYNIALREEYPVDTRYITKDKKGRYYRDFRKEEKEKYYDQGLDLKKQIEGLLENPEKIQDIWK